MRLHFASRAETLLCSAEAQGAPKNTNAFLAGLVQQALSKNGINSDAIQIITDPDRDLVGELITAREYIDVLFPAAAKV